MTLTYLHALQDILNKKILEMETKVEALIETKLGETLFSNEVQSTGEEKSSSTSVKPTYANRVGLIHIPDAVKQAIQEERNDSKVEESEKDKRKKNIIIHGADEIGDNKEQVRNEDIGFVKEIFTKLGVTCLPKAITRLGEPNERKKRPLKIVMNTLKEKNQIMSNLNRLKGTENEFGRISIKEDYTNHEREEIKTWVQKAKEKSASDKDYIYKVRGDLKNGLRLVSFARHN